MNKILWTIIIILILLLGGTFFWMKNQTPLVPEPTVPEPTTGNTMYLYKDLVRLTSPLANEVITSPLTIKGEARGNWFFEASFPVKLLDGNGNPVPLEPGYVMATGEWMTTNYVPFQSSHTFIAPATPTGTLILQKDNPSGEPQFDDSFSIPVRFIP
jgi:hypothetical protein